MLAFKATFLLSVASGIQVVLGKNFGCGPDHPFGACQNTQHFGGGTNYATSNAQPIDVPNRVYGCDQVDKPYCCPQKVSNSETPVADMGCIPSKFN
ncbi:hypothetical protein MJO28_000553 [Puccinia striiformis f. sp. tritici]|uniref:Hydrophobin n=4 Tax=Puccinia striiformis TaxID=27350 RepID=A0A0L0W5S3_9BASI|nr:hypothetical protein Pst134EA_000683 [Puccinia striiformis f. sp. tritici]KAI9601102.1 hypothetical protein H4Q26_000901 [Puccinia striiformis f. sp. tritici PST-130]KNF06830.1 hypothetical protein PSTG_00143 [Puccinia striiformis f. sp. tritici PST-78]POV98316.1 hypothetical protein PSTT_14512 [Puccinia striiformis]KAH9466835.1 hypothetical protein Pst134EB_001887 [Puccinia striiformis f. sp. tritici]KAH9473601.1 hypothetical protein Pst134EA_000683 [Puccinia striiformis f. sp. tritici]